MARSHTAICKRATTRTIRNSIRRSEEPGSGRRRRSRQTPRTRRPKTRPNRCSTISSIGWSQNSAAGGGASAPSSACAPTGRFPGIAGWASRRDRPLLQEEASAVDAGFLAKPTAGYRCVEKHAVSRRGRTVRRRRPGIASRNLFDSIGHHAAFAPLSISLRPVRRVDRYSPNLEKIMRSLPALSCFFASARDESLRGKRTPTQARPASGQHRKLIFDRAG
jgi:hypothetical protein